MKVLTPESRVGLLVIVAAFALLYISFKTAGVPMFGGGNFIKFYIDFPSVSGVEESSKVSLSGVEIGQIELIELMDDHARVTVRLFRKADIRVDSVATIRTAGLLGEQFISITQGEPGAQLLQDGDTLMRVQEPADLGDIATGVQSLIAENRDALKLAIQNLADITNEFAKTAPNLAENLDKTMKGLREIIENNQDNITTSITNAKDLTALLKVIVKENRSSLKATVANAEELTALLKVILKENRSSLKTTMTNLAEASGKIDGLIASLKNTSDSFGTVANQISEGDGTLGKLVTDDEVYDNLNDALVGANHFLNKTDSIGLYLGIRTERVVGWNDSRAYVSLKVRTKEDRFYLLEVTQDIRDEEAKKNSDFNKILYTALVAKRFSDLTLRGGLIESSAGVGVDYHLFDDSVEFSAEFFNLSGYNDLAPDPQIRVTARWNFLKYLYVYAGGEELLNDEYRTLLIGGGIMFNDEELKLALGLL